jgi:vacuolar-type H+-ATPase subunit H
MGLVESDRAKLSPALNATAQTQLKNYAFASAQEFQALAESDAKKWNHYSAKAAEFRASAQRFQGSSEQNADLARRLAGGDQVVGQQNVDKQFVQNQYVGEDKKTVSADTWVGLGGAALITAGAVGGIYLVGNKLVKKGDKAAEMRIAQAEESANRVIKNAEETAKRIIEFAVSSAGKIITNVEEAATRIYEKAKEDVQKLIGDLTEEVKAQFKNLSTEGLKKLRGEFESMFTGLIEKAKKEGNSALVTSLTNAWASLATTIDTEIASRKSTATSTSTSTGTSSTTSTSVSTSSSTSTATSSATSSSTSSATSSSTSSRTSSSSATYTGTYTNNRM